MKFIAFALGVVAITALGMLATMSLIWTFDEMAYDDVVGPKTFERYKVQAIEAHVIGAALGILVTLGAFVVWSKVYEIR